MSAEMTVMTLGFAALLFAILTMTVALDSKPVLPLLTPICAATCLGSAMLALVFAGGRLAEDRAGFYVSAGVHAVAGVLWLVQTYREHQAAKGCDVEDGAR